MIEIEKVRASSRDQYWKMLKNAYTDYLTLVNGTEYNEGINGFYYYMQQNYGIQVELIDGKFGSAYNIINDKKYFLFQLKYA